MSSNKFHKSSEVTRLIFIKRTLFLMYLIKKIQFVTLKERKKTATILISPVYKTQRAKFKLKWSSNFDKIE